MPHLSKLQAKHADDGVTIIGVTKEDKSNTLEAVKTMTEDKGDTMAYSVAWDNAGATYKSFMGGTKSRGIPTSFIVDKEGRLAFYGHPMELDEPLAKIVAGTWDPVKDFGAILEKREQRQAMSKDLNTIHRASQHSVTGKEAGALMEQWRGMEEKYGETLADMPNLKYRVLTACGEYAAAAPIGRMMVDKAVEAKSPSGLNEFAWNVVDPERKLEKRDLALAMYAATVACNLTDYKDGAILDTLARAHFSSGGIARAIELQKLAVEHSEGRMQEGIKEVLKEYEEASAL